MGRVKGAVFLNKLVLELTDQASLVRLKDFWHGHLGHPARQVITLLAKNLNFSVSSNKKVK